MTRFICKQCGTQYPDSDQPPAGCTICLDDRQYVRFGGQEWTTLDELRQTRTLTFTEEGEGITGIGMEPPFAINQRPLLLQSKAGNVLWDCCTVLTDAAVAEIKTRGGLTAIAAFCGILMNFTFLYAGSVSSNPTFIVLGVLIIVGWRVAGWWGLDRYLLPWLGTPWQLGRMRPQPPAAAPPLVQRR